MKAAFLICVLFLTACHARSQEQGNSDSARAVVDTTSLFDQLRHENPALFKMMVEDSEETSIFNSRYENLPPDNPERINFNDTMMVHGMIRRAKIHEWTPDLLSHGTPLQLMSASMLMFGTQLQRMAGAGIGMPFEGKQNDRDTSDSWDAYQLATRAVSLGKPGASESARLALSLYAMGHGKRVNSDSIINSVMSNSRKSSGNDEDMSSSTPEIQWQTSYSAALKIARDLHSNMLLMFTSGMCTNCSVAEDSLHTYEVRRLLNNFLCVRLNTDEDSPNGKENIAFEKKRFNSIAIPYFAIVSPKGKTLTTLNFSYRSDIKSFLRLYVAKN